MLQFHLAFCCNVQHQIVVDYFDYEGTYDGNEFLDGESYFDVNGKV